MPDRDPGQYTYDYVCGEAATQSDIFTGVPINPLCQACTASHACGATPADPPSGMQALV